MKKHLRNITAHLLNTSSVNALCRFSLRGRVFVFAYHSVHKSGDISEKNALLYPHITIEASQFEERLCLLIKRGHTFTTFSGLKDCKGPRPTIIYFDDGFKDVYTVALPILKRYNIPATVFLTSGLIDGTHSLWTITHREFRFSQGWGEEDIRKEIQMLKGMRHNEREEFLREIYNKTTFVPRGKELFLSWNEVKDLVEYGWEIGSHAVSHKKLTECSPEELHYEVAHSKQIIEEHLGRPVVSFSYPHGRTNKEIDRPLCDFGYRCITSGGLGTVAHKRIRGACTIFKNISVHDGDTPVIFLAKTYTLSFIRMLGK